jgi:hypothetical protein
MIYSLVQFYRQPIKFYKTGVGMHSHRDERRITHPEGATAKWFEQKIEAVLRKEDGIKEPPKVPSHKIHSIKLLKSRYLREAKTTSELVKRLLDNLPSKGF